MEIFRLQQIYNSFKINIFILDYWNLLHKYFKEPSTCWLRPAAFDYETTLSNIHREGPSSGQLHCCYSWFVFHSVLRGHLSLGEIVYSEFLHLQEKALLGFIKNKLHLKWFPLVMKNWGCPVLNRLSRMLLNRLYCSRAVLDTFFFSCKCSNLNMRVLQLLLSLQPYKSTFDVLQMLISS
jgi:hypothetical protein